MGWENERNDRIFEGSRKTSGNAGKSQDTGGKRTPRKSDFQYALDRSKGGFDGAGTQNAQETVMDLKDAPKEYRKIVDEILLLDISDSEKFRRLRSLRHFYKYNTNAPISQVREYALKGGSKMGNGTRTGLSRRWIQTGYDASQASQGARAGNGICLSFLLISKQQSCRKRCEYNGFGCNLPANFASGINGGKINSASFGAVETNCAKKHENRRKNNRFAVQEIRLQGAIPTPNRAYAKCGTQKLQGWIVFSKRRHYVCGRNENAMARTRSTWCGRLLVRPMHFAYKQRKTKMFKLKDGRTVRFEKAVFNPKGMVMKK